MAQVFPRPDPNKINSLVEFSIWVKLCKQTSAMFDFFYKRKPTKCIDTSLPSVKRLHSQSERAKYDQNSINECSHAVMIQRDSVKKVMKSLKLTEHKSHTSIQHFEVPLQMLHKWTVRGKTWKPHRVNQCHFWREKHVAVTLNHTYLLSQLLLLQLFLQKQERKKNNNVISGFVLPPF